MKWSSGASTIKAAIMKHGPPLSETKGVLSAKNISQRYERHRLCRF
jgi:hypothetical protein